MSDKYVVSDESNKEREIQPRNIPVDSSVAQEKAENSDETQESIAEPLSVPEPPESFYCSNCRLQLGEDKLVKQPIEYTRNEDGSYSTIATRFSVFCKQCYKFLRVLDPNANKMLNDMIRKGVK